MRLKTGLAYAALGLASAGVVGAGVETIRSAQNPTHEEVAHTNSANQLRDQIDHLNPDAPSPVRDELRNKQTHELIAVSTSEWQRDNMQLLGVLVTCVGASALVLGGAKIYIDDKDPS